MTQTVKTCPKILALLDTFRRPDADDLPWDATIVDQSQVPEPYHRLLVHPNDMTSTLTRYHGEPMSLRVLGRVFTDGTLARHVVLAGSRTGRSLEYGASRIHLDALDDHARRKVLEGRTPLGGVLVGLGVTYRNCPGAFFTVRSAGVVDRAFGLAEPRWLFGRCNCLNDPSGRPIAEVVEILPPADTLA